LKSFSDTETGMKKQSRQRGGGSGADEQTITSSRSGCGKILSEKDRALIVARREAELAAAERKVAEWCREHGVADCDAHDDAREPGRQAAYDDRCEEEECRELIGKFAPASAKRTGDGIGEVVDCYETIVMEFLVARYAGKSLSGLLCRDYETDKALTKFLSELGQWLKRYAVRCIRGEPPYRCPVNGSDDVQAIETLRGHAVNERLMTALGVQYVKDAGGLMKFLKAVFKHWRKINRPDSLFRQRLLTHQLRGTPKEIASALEELGVVATSTTEHQFRSSCSRVRQYRSRDPKVALKRRAL
jgi:hypothetical protein